MVALMLAVAVPLADPPVPKADLGLDGSLVDQDLTVLPSSDAGQMEHQEDDSMGEAGPAQLVEYTLPVSPTNLLIGSGDTVWFSSFQSEFGGADIGALGLLDPGTQEVTIYPMRDGGKIWGLAQESPTELWYTTVSGGRVGRFETTTSSFVEWTIPWHHYGLAWDADASVLWFTTPREEVPGIYRLHPATNAVTVWATDPYTTPYDLVQDAAGYLWFTVQPLDHQGVGRLDPSTNQLTFWEMPLAKSRPFRLVAASPDEIWFTELAPDANSVAVLIPSINTLREYRIPTSAAYPASLLLARDGIWFTAYAAGMVTRLQPDLSSATTTPLVPQTMQALTTTVTVMPSTFSARPEIVKANKMLTQVTPTVKSGFAEFALPDAGDRPFGIAHHAHKGQIWYAASDGRKIGKLVPADAKNYLFLPLTTKRAPTRVSNQR
jgi:streptogramin lyase